MALPNTLKNSNFTQKYIVDADKLMENFQYVLDQIGETPLQNLIIATGQPYNKLNAQQLVTAIIQLILAGQYFTDKSTAVNSLLLTPSVSSYSNPFTYIDNMEFVFTPAYTNTGAVTILFDGLDSTAYTKPLVDRAGNPLLDSAIVAGKSYCAHYSSDRDAFILGSLRDSTNNAYSEAALAFVEDVVESLGITFSSLNPSQLSKALAEYSLLTTYKDVSTSADLNGQIYRIKPFNEEGSSITTLASPFEYYNGMTIRFTPSYDNNSSDAYIVIDTLTPIALKQMDGSNVAAGDIRQGIDIVIRYVNSVFYLVSNKISNLSLNSGVSVNSIESSLSSNNKSIPTSSAVKNAIDTLDTKISNVKKSLLGKKAFCVAGSEGDPYIYIDTSAIIMQSGVELVYSDYSYEVTDTPYTFDLSSTTGDFVVLYTKGSGLSCIPTANYTESFELPSSTAANGDAYVYIDSSGKITTSIYNSTLGSWVETPFIKVAFGSETGGAFTIKTIPFNGRYIVETSSIPTSSSSTTVTHNLGSLCNIKATLICTATDLAYNAGDVIVLSSFVTSSNFLTIGSSPTEAVVSTSDILLPNSGGTPAAITASKWKMLLDIERAF